MLSHENNRLVFEYDGETVWIEPWGSNALRVRASKSQIVHSDAQGLESDPPQGDKPDVSFHSDGSATITSGNISASVTKRGKITFRDSRSNKVVLEEYMRSRQDLTDPKCSALSLRPREFKPLLGGDYHLTARFESQDPNEKIFGMGQYQQPYLDLKGLDLELAHRNSQASVPFSLSSSGYGFLWNNPAIGRAVFGKNLTTYEAYSTNILDYWIVVGDTPAEILESYTAATGRPPQMPEYGLGFWQCKLRYETQEELLQVAREYHKRQLPLDVIVIDFFHWPVQGEWKFDPKYWPDPASMVKELKSLGVELMVSIWPTVDYRSENFQEMRERGLLVRTERGLRTNFDFEGQTVYFDATRPEAREYLWSKAKEHYHAYGIKTFWLDEAEPEFSVYDFDNYRYYQGPVLKVGNIYPREYARTFYEGVRQEEKTDSVVNLLRCAWVGSQKLGALVWSGDIASSWPSFRNQLAAGLNMGIAGLSWWTTDIGGFHGGDPSKEEFRELFVRWFQWGAFCPVMRLHGDRDPKRGEHPSSSGADNEVWSYGPEVYEICKKYLAIREKLRPYTRRLMEEASSRGSPVMRTLFYEFPKDPRSWEVHDQYMYGDTYLCCPVLRPGIETMTVYLPPLETGETWADFYDEERTFQSGGTIKVACPRDQMPVFTRKSPKK